MPHTSVLISSVIAQADLPSFLFRNWHVLSLPLKLVGGSEDRFYCNKIFFILSNLATCMYQVQGAYFAIDSGIHPISHVYINFDDY